MTANAPPSWSRIADKVWLWPDSCNVYAFEAPDGMVLVNAGTGRWLNALEQLPNAVVALLCTHYFRDHSAGAAEAASAGIPVYAPAGEAELFEDPHDWLRQRSTYVMYDNLWDTYVPLDPVPLADVLRDYESPIIAGARWDVVPLPGATLTQSGYITEIVKDDASSAVCFCGEAVYAGGRVARLAPLQYNYNDLAGAVHAYASAAQLERRALWQLYPSLGPAIPPEATQATLRGVQAAMRRACARRPAEAALVDHVDRDRLERISDHVWMSTQGHAISWFLVSETGQVMAIDYGYRTLQGPDWRGPGGEEWPAYSRPTTRRPLLHSLDALGAAVGASQIDTVLVSHYHDDHVAGIPALKRRFGTRVWASEGFAPLLQQPSAHKFPCTWPEPIQVDRVLPAEGTVEWNEYELRLHPMSGHTRFSTLIGFTADGIKYAHTGDQYFLLRNSSCRGTGDASYDGQMLQNHVYRNGAEVDSYRRSLDWLLDWDPHLLLTGHQRPLRFDSAMATLFGEWASEYESLHRQAMCLDDGEAHFGLDSLAGFIWPYRSFLPEPGVVAVVVTARNPLPVSCQISLRLRGPKGVVGTEVLRQVEPRAEISTELRIELSAPCRRMPIALEFTADGQPFGQVAEALVTIGGRAF